MSEQVTCRCKTPMTLQAGDRQGTLAGGAEVTKSFCFACNTLLEIVDGQAKATPMVPAVMPEAVRETDFFQRLQANTVSIDAGERVTILAALSQPDLRPTLEWLAERIATYWSKPSSASTAQHWVAAAIAATAPAQEGGGEDD